MKNIRSKQEVFESDHITIFELSILFEGSYEEMYRQMQDQINSEVSISVENRFEILDL